MTVGDMRKLTEGMPDSAPYILLVASSANLDDELNVVIEQICKSHDGNQIHIHVSIVPDAELMRRTEIERNDAAV